jgi:hypothetical protein
MSILALYLISRDYTFSIGNYRFGFQDGSHDFVGDVTLLHLGPLGGYYRMPVPAAWCVIITALLVAALLAAPFWLRWRFRRLA